MQRPIFEDWLLERFTHGRQDVVTELLQHLFKQDMLVSERYRSRGMTRL